MVEFGKASRGLAIRGKAWRGLARSSVARFGKVCHGKMRFGMARTFRIIYSKLGTNHPKSCLIIIPRRGGVITVLFAYF